MTDVRTLIVAIADKPWGSDWHLAEIASKRTKIKRWTIYNWLLGRSSPTQHTIIYLRGIAAGQ